MYNKNKCYSNIICCWVSEPLRHILLFFSAVIAAAFLAKPTHASVERESVALD